MRARDTFSYTHNIVARAFLARRSLPSVQANKRAIEINAMMRIPKTLMLAILLGALLAVAFFAGRLQEQSRFAGTDMDWLGSTDPRIFSKVDWAAPIDDIVFSSMEPRSAGGSPTYFEMTHVAMTENGIKVLVNTELSRATVSDEWSLVRMLSTPINPDGPTVLTKRVDRDGLNLLQVIVEGSRTQPGQMRIEYDAENGERKSVVYGTPGAFGSVSFPIEDAVGLGNIQVEILD